MSKNILWTGSHGFIAGYAISKLLDKGHRVWGVDNFWKYGETAKEYDTHPNFTFIKGDAKDVELLKKIVFENKINIFVAGAAIIGGITLFHELAYDILAENEKLTCAAFDVCIDAYKNDSFFEKIVVISSSMVYENVNHYPSSETDIFDYPPPSSTYGFQKLATEYFAKGAHEQYKLPYTIIRPFNAIGVGEKRAKFENEVYSGNIKMAMSHVLPDLVQKIYKGQFPVHILGSGEQIRHYTYTGDLANGIIECMFHPNALNNDFNISTDKGHTVIELAEAVWKYLGKTEPIEFINDTPYVWDVQKRVPDTEKSKELLGVKCETSLEDSLNEIVPWIIQQINIGNI
jgi:nucleoside-diphosphate-sugar epimerase